MLDRVDSYDEVYAVSNIGRIRNSRTGLVLKARINRTGYLIVDLCKKGDKTTFPVHKLVADAYLQLTEDEDQIFIDHINNNKLDNTICNLRRASRSQNNRNCSMQANTSSRYKGVYKDKKSTKWIAQITMNRKQQHLGRFDDEKEAGKRYNTEATRLFGEFAKLNEFSDDEV